MIGMSSMDSEAFWKNFAGETVRRSVHLTVMPELDSTLDEILKTCACHGLKPEAGHSTVLVYYDEKLASEAQNQPSARKCPARKSQMEMCLMSKLAADGGNVAPGVLYILPDHGKSGNAAAFKQLFVKALTLEGGVKKEL